MLRAGFFQRLTLLAARSVATVPRQAASFQRGLMLESPMSATLSKLKSLHQPWLKQPQWLPMVDPVSKGGSETLAEEKSEDTMHMDSVLRKRRLKMKKHKLRKRRRLQRSLKKRLGKI